MRIDELLKGAAERLTFVSDTTQLDVQLLLSHVLSVPTSYFYTWPDKEVEEEAFNKFEALLSRRVSGEPIAYLLGAQSFWTLDLEVATCTLIPRADTERLVEVVLERLESGSAYSLLDLGTGTGAIALALASELPRSQVLGIDLMEDAVALAKRNAIKNQIANAEFMQSSWFDSIEAGREFDVIVSNPPYIDPEDAHLSQGDVRFEPKTALIADNKGLADIEHILLNAPDYLKPNGYLIFEHGYDQAAAVQKRFREVGFVKVESFQDIGGNDRVTLGVWKQ
ncbi:peptide chain release factor N(5)-glutamine methyltransferase [Marinomonas sp. C2222]|uniref:Release factor glutamine methyltransferase n=1 Tax=Marinomonas sargassi TaxID=2984494 RepID=A0ABT2YV04_9GAMM|nr:peptide chain release factor N(5)-glutamine methyltransferase [Marinomonas sargassi]MCV2403716.1 peptide chain release factor N(5)-glutamine methyltransferase [Marinomonas sargassi]